MCPRVILEDFEKSLDPAGIRTPDNPARSLVIVLTALCRLIFCHTAIFNIILLLLLTTIEFSLGGSNPYTSIDKTNKNKFT